MLQACQDYSWPGNLRELSNFIKRYLVLGDEKLAIQELQPRDGRRPEPGPKRLTARAKPIPADSNPWPAAPRTKPKPKPSAKLSSRPTGTASRLRRCLQISYKALLYKIRQYGIAQTKSHKLPPALETRFLR